MDNEKLKAKELNDSKLNEVTGGSGLGMEMETYQEYCSKCGYVFYEDKHPKGMGREYVYRPTRLCPQCDENVEVKTRTF